MTRLPTYLYVDQRGPAEDAVREALDAASITAHGDREYVERLHRVLYPVYRVAFSYETGEGKLFGTADRDDAILLDGLWAENDRPLTQYVEHTADLVRTPTNDYDLGAEVAGLGSTVLFEFQVPEERAAATLPNRIEEFRQVSRDGSPTVYLRELRERYGLPGDFDPDGFGGVDRIERCYLPFWLAEITADGAEDTAVVTLRDDAVDEEHFRRHAWLAEFVSEDPRRLAEYGYEVDLERLQRRLGEDTGESADGARRDQPSSSGGGRAGGGDGDSGSERGTGAPGINRAPSSPEREVLTPDGVELNAESLVDPTPNRTFADVGGMDELIETLRHKVVRPLEDPESFERYGLGVVNGVLLHGPPGCGKTYVAGALAGELGHPFLSVTPADLTSKYMGEPAQNVADLFAIAGANAPCTLFIDEIDGIGGTRDADGGMNASERQMVNQLLSELEDLPDDVVVLGATNLVDDVDSAIRRSGRFDERIEVPPPDAPARREILRIHLADRPHVEDLALSAAVEATAGYAASDLELLADDAARRALRQEAPIDEEHLAAAVEDVDTSIPDWTAPDAADAGDVVQPTGVDLRARTLVDPNPARTFEDVGGMADLKDRLEETVVEPLSNPGEYEEYGIDVLSGLLLYGPPGCGKTYVTRALAGEMGHSLIEVSPADVTSKWMGEPAQNVADLFAIADANAPCVLFLDELDAVGGSRRGASTGSEQGMVNQLLTELESVPEDVVVVGATNFVEDVDQALRRSGRFDARIEVPPPGADARRAILQVHLAERPVADAVDWTPVVEATAGHAASDLALLAENAARRAMAADAPVDDDHLQAAVEETGSSIENWNGRDRYAEKEDTTDLRYYG